VFTPRGELEPGYLVAAIAVALLIFIIILVFLAGMAVSPPMALPP
jgi:hypothetical protein